MPLSLRAASVDDIPRIAAVSMAAFDPATDAISRNLFSGANSYDGFRQWSVLRKSARLTAQRSVMVVVVDDQVTDTAGVQRGLVVGYAIWFIPLAHCEEEDQSPPKKPQAVAGLDMAAVSVLREAMMKDELESFGDKGARDVWSTFCCSILVFCFCGFS